MSVDCRLCSVCSSLVKSLSFCFVVASSCTHSSSPGQNVSGLCYERLFRETGSLTSGPPMLHTFPFIRDTVENVAWSCGRGGKQLAGEVISSCLCTFWGFFLLLFSIVLLCITENLENISVIFAYSNHSIWIKVSQSSHTTKTKFKYRLSSQLKRVDTCGLADDGL